MQKQTYRIGANIGQYFTLVIMVENVGRLIVYIEDKTFTFSQHQLFFLNGESTSENQPKNNYGLFVCLFALMVAQFNLQELNCQRK